MKNSIILTLLVLVLGLIFVACGGGSTGDGGSGGSGGIYGTVTDFDTGEPVQNANVQLRPSGNTAITGSDGMFEFRDINPGDYKLKVSATGYKDLIDDYVITVEDKMMRRDVQIANKCAKNHCGTHGTCEARTVDDNYNCICDDGYFNEGYMSSGKCVSPCDPNPCGNEACIATEYDEYECGAVFPECVASNKTPCKYDGYIWSARARKDLDWNSAMTYCDELSEGGYSDWSLPSADVLDTLNRYGASGNIFGEDDIYWSSSTCDQGAISLYFYNHGQDCDVVTETYSVRCVRW